MTDVFDLLAGTPPALVAASYWAAIAIALHVTGLGKSLSFADAISTLRKGA